MKAVLTTMLIVFVCSCSTANKAVAKAPTAPPSQGTLSQHCEDPSTDCTHTNGTQATGLTGGDQATTIRAVTLTSCEIITLR